MIELFKNILVALACPLVLPLVMENIEDKDKLEIDISLMKIATESEDKE